MTRPAQPPWRSGCAASAISSDQARNPQQNFAAGFDFQLTKLFTTGVGTSSAATYSTTDNLTTQGSAKSVTAVGGFLYTSAGLPATGANGYHVRIWPGSAGASCSSGAPILDVASDDDGYYFAGPLAANVQYFVQVCKGTTAVATRTLPHKLANGEFIEEDFSGLP